MKKPKETKVNRKFSGQKVWAITGALVILVILLFICRGWIREKFLPNQVSYFAKKSMEKAYTQSHGSLAQPLRELQVSLAANVHTACRLYGAKSVQTAVTCDNSAGDIMDISAEYIDRFKQNSITIEQQILQRGWTKTWNEQQPINELFKNPNNDASVGVNYEKKYGKNTCELSLFYNANEKNPSKLHSILSCNRLIYYLGNPSS